MRLRREAPGAGESELVAALVEDVDRALGDPEQLRGRDVRLP